MRSSSFRAAEPVWTAPYQGALHHITTRGRRPYSRPVGFPPGDHSGLLRAVMAWRSRTMGRGRCTSAMINTTERRTFADICDICRLFGRKCPRVKPLIFMRFFRDAAEMRTLAYIRVHRVQTRRVSIFPHDARWRHADNSLRRINARLRGDTTKNVAPVGPRKSLPSPGGRSPRSRIDCPNRAFSLGLGRQHTQCKVAV